MNAKWQWSYPIRAISLLVFAFAGLSIAHANSQLGRWQVQNSVDRISDEITYEVTQESHDGDYGIFSVNCQILDGDYTGWLTYVGENLSNPTGQGIPAIIWLRVDQNPAIRVDSEIWAHGGISFPYKTTKTSFGLLFNLDTENTLSLLAQMQSGRALTIRVGAYRQNIRSETTFSLRDFAATGQQVLQACEIDTGH